MKTLTFSVTIHKPVSLVYQTMLDPDKYTQWASAWGEGMVIEGRWEKGAHVSFFDNSQGGTKALIEDIVPNSYVKTKHVAMVNTENVELEPSDDMMKKWIGTQEDYDFIAVDPNTTRIDVTIVIDEAFEEMMQVWPQALQTLKDMCESI